MKINRKSWHYRFNDFFFDTADKHDLPTGRTLQFPLCPVGTLLRGLAEGLIPGASQRRCRHEKAT
jgi:hypothetical protein